MQSRIDQIMELKSIQKREFHREVSIDTLSPLSPRSTKRNTKHKLIIFILLFLGIFSIYLSWIRGHEYKTNFLEELEGQIRRQSKLIFSPLIKYRWDTIDAFHKLAESRAADLYPYDEKIAYRPTNFCHDQIAIFLQISLIHLWKDMLPCIANVASAAAMKGCEKVDVYVSVMESSKGSKHQKADQLKSDLMNLNLVNKVVIQDDSDVESDMTSFIGLISQIINMEKPYKFILKLHTNFNEKLRKHALESLCGTPEQVISIIDHFSKQPKLDLIAPRGTIVGPSTDPSTLFLPLVHSNLVIKLAFKRSMQKKIKKIHEILFPDELNDKPESTNRVSFNDMATVEGAMFWSRYNALNAPTIVGNIASIKATFLKEQSQLHILQQLFERIIPTEILVNKRWIAEIPPAPRIIAIYSPQFYETKDNTDYFGTTSHGWNLNDSNKIINLHEPFAEIYGGLGTYDLMSIVLRVKQAKLAKQFGVNGFLFQHYWFDGDEAPERHKVLHKVAEQMLLDNEPDIPFAFIWNNDVSLANSLHMLWSFLRDSYLFIFSFFLVAL